MPEVELKQETFADLPESLRKLIALLADGFSSREAAKELGIALRTVELRRSQLAKRLGATTVFQMGYLAAKLDGIQEKDSD